MNPEFLDILIFEVDGQRHGIAAADVQVLLPALTIAPLPGAPVGVEGVINLRGAVVPVLDVRRRFGMPAKELGLADHFIVVRWQDRLTALHVDRALELVRLNIGALAEVETARVAKWQDGLVPLHSVRDLLASAEGTP
jgi:purine-binding chemotaxis protein CheW